MNKGRRIIRLCLVFVLILLCFVVINRFITNARTEKQEYDKGAYYSANEFVRTINCAPVFDDNPNAKFVISFDIRATNEGDIIVYQQNGSGSRYGFQKTVHVSTEYEHFDIQVSPIIADENLKESYLAFYGIYNSGVKPIIKNIEVVVSNGDT